MPKRKRDGDAIEAEASDKGYGSMKQQRVEHKLEHGQKLLARAFKTARGFERQKLGRRRKTAAQEADAKDVSRIDAETTALKTLDLSVAATNYLNKSLLKFKAVAQSPDLPKSVSNSAPQSQDTPALNVVARLCNSNPVKEALAPILKDVQQALGIKVAEGAAKGRKRKRGTTQDKAETSESAEEEDNFAKRQPAKREQLNGHGKDLEDDEEESSFEGFSSRIASTAEDEDEDSDEKDLDFSKFNSRLAASPDNEDDLSDPDEAPEHQLRKGATSRKAARQLSISPSPSPSPEPARQRPTRSAFIPSLTTGYISGSGSDLDSDVDIAPKKNRRGQRARQALAEKKFGSRAKHLANGQSVGQKDRNSGWDAKRGATDGPRTYGRGGARGGRGGGRGGFGDRGGRGDAAGSGAKSAEPPKKHRDDEGALHPSWAAAKKAKEAKVAAPFQGKKITFD